MSLLVIAYPEIEKKDYAWIQSVREKHDERFYKVVEPHFTFVFPVFNIKEKDFIEHASSIAKKFNEFYFVLRCAQIVKDSFSEYTDVFLIPEEGYRIFVKLHDALYTKILKDELRLDIHYVPHLGIANNFDANRCKQIADEINKANIEIVGAVKKLEIISYENESIKHLKSILL